MGVAHLDLPPRPSLVGGGGDVPTHDGVGVGVGCEAEDGQLAQLGGKGNGRNETNLICIKEMTKMKLI